MSAAAFNVQRTEPFLAMHTPQSLFACEVCMYFLPSEDNGTMCHGARSGFFYLTFVSLI